jgi:hypothetical protein
MTNTTPRRTGKVSRPSRCSDGTTSTSTDRAASNVSIVRRTPHLLTRSPDGIPRSATGNSSTAKTSPIRVADPVVVRTNHGSARKVIWVPRAEMNSEVTIARIDRWVSTRRAVHRDGWPWGTSCSDM